VRQLLIFHGLGINGIDYATRQTLWTFPWTNMPKVNAAQPIKLADQSLLIGSGYGVGSARLELTPAEGEWQVEPKWKSTRLKLKFNDAILLDGYLYGLDDGILTCLDPANGK